MSLWESELAVNALNGEVFSHCSKKPKTKQVSRTGTVKFAGSITKRYEDHCIQSSSDQFSWSASEPHHRWPDHLHPMVFVQITFAEVLWENRISVRDLLQSPLHEQRFHAWIPACKVAVHLLFRLTATLAQDRCAELISVRTGQSAVFVEPREGIGIHHFAPDVGVVVGRIIRPAMIEVAALVAWWYLRNVQTVLLQGSGFECGNVGNTRCIGTSAVPFQSAQCSGQGLSGGRALVAFAGLP